MSRDEDHRSDNAPVAWQLGSAFEAAAHVGHVFQKSAKPAFNGTMSTHLAITNSLG
ncbi:hypothetical protein [Roseicyclus elongatus]|uniref:hypothetical protein n=1 Tax=Roseicyclus elongatus TaxID=159346 RepID=UPI0018DCBB5F|nr:hypothetical protein [Roseibacterium elongatum]